MTAEGWGAPKAKRWGFRWHYFVAGVSLCGKHSPAPFTWLQTELAAESDVELCARCRSRSSRPGFLARRAARLGKLSPMPATVTVTATVADRIPPAGRDA